MGGRATREAQKGGGGMVGEGVLRESLGGPFGSFPSDLGAGLRCRLSGRCWIKIN